MAARFIPFRRPVDTAPSPVPDDLRGQMGTRFCLRVMTRYASEIILGPGSPAGDGAAVVPDARPQLRHILHASAFHPVRAPKYAARAALCCYKVMRRKGGR